MRLGQAPTDSSKLVRKGQRPCLRRARAAEARPPLPLTPLLGRCRRCRRFSDPALALGIDQKLVAAQAEFSCPLRVFIPIFSVLGGRIARGPVKAQWLTLEVASCAF